MTSLSRRLLLARGSTAALAGVAAPHLWAQPDFNAKASLRVGTTSYISAGPLMIAQARGYFRRLNLEVDARPFVDGALSMPSLAAGELDIANATLSAGVFNLVAKGTGIRLVMERGREAPGMGSNAVLVSNALYDKGFTSLDGYRLAKGVKISVQARGAVAEYLHAVALQRAGVKPSEVDWQWGLDTRASLALMKQNQIGVLNYPLPGANAAVKQGVGKIATWSDQIAPNFVLICTAVGQKMLGEGHSPLVRFCMAILQANRDYMAAAREGHPETLKILAEGTGLPVAVIEETRPRWTFMSTDGLPNTASVIAQQAHWHDQTDLLAKSVPEPQLFDFRALREAGQRLADKNPFT